jgi:hypothetical protein
MKRLGEIFDELLEVAGTDEFDERRLEIIEREIKSLPEDKQLAAKQQQWRIEGQLRGLTGTARYNRMVELFWEGFIELHKALNGDR